MVSIVGGAALLFGKHDTKFSDVALSLPENDVMVLQGKSKKIPGKKYPDCTDGFLAPEIDMRHAFKVRRQDRKALLKELQDLARVIANNINVDPAMQGVFEKFTMFFLNCIRLMDNEKLRLVYEYSDTTSDIHPNKLFSLTTRDKTPIHTFLHGFLVKCRKGGMNILQGWVLIKMSQ